MSGDQNVELTRVYFFRQALRQLCPAGNMVNISSSGSARLGRSRSLVPAFLSLFQTGILLEQGPGIALFPLVPPQAPRPLGLSARAPSLTRDGAGRHPPRSALTQHGRRPRSSARCPHQTGRPPFTPHCARPPLAPRRLRRLQRAARKDGGSDCGRLNSREAAKSAHKGGGRRGSRAADPWIRCRGRTRRCRWRSRAASSSCRTSPAGTPSPARPADKQITDLKKENFNLKLRIYFLEERMQQKFDGPTEEIYKINIELKVEIESLKRELQEREKLLIKAYKAVESLAQGGDAEVQHGKEAQKRMQEMEEMLTGRINVLEENLKAAQEEVGKALAMTEKEKALRTAAEQKLASIINAPAKDVDKVTEAEKDRLIEQLNMSLKNKEALIQHLEKEKSQSGCSDGNLPAEKIRELTIALRLEKDSEIEALRMELKNERSSFEKKIQSLQEELQERENELAVEKKNGLKRDKTIQGLTVALKAKEKENEELASEIEELNASLAKAREATHKAHVQKFKGAADYQALLMEKETLLAELRSENLTKDAENRRLQRIIKVTGQELSDLNLEREKMEKELDEAQLQKSRSDKTINDLRNQLEKLHGEMSEKEKAVEHHYNILLSESNQKLQSQELVIRQLTDSVNHKDLLLERLDGTVKEKDAELQELQNKCKNLLRANEELELKNEGLVEEKCAAQTQQSIIKIVRELEENKEAEYEKLILALRKEQNIYSTLVKTFKESDSINSLQVELNNIFMLRKQLEEDVLGNRNLQKILQDQIKDMKNHKDETLSFCGDQTSYMSICLGEQDHLSLQIDHLSLEELKKKVADLLLMVKELQSINQELKARQSGCCTKDSQGKEALEILNHKECLETAEKPVMQPEDGGNDKKVQNSQFCERVSQVCLQVSLDFPCEVDKQITPSGYSESFCKDRHYRSPIKPQFEHDTTDKHLRTGMSEHETEENLLTSLLRENRTSVLESTRQEQMKFVNELLDHLNTTEEECSSEDIEKKDEKDLRQMIIQLRAQLKHFKQVTKFLKQRVELKSTFDGEEKLYPDAVPQINKASQLLKVELKDAAMQTMTLESNVMRFKHEGKKGASEEKSKYSRLNAEAEHQQENVYKKGEQHERLSFTRTNEAGSASLPKKSRLPVPVRPCRALGNVSLLQKSAPEAQHPSRAPPEGLRACEIETKPFQVQPNGELLHESGAENLPEEPAQGNTSGRVVSLLKLDNTETQVEFQDVDPGTEDKNENVKDKNQQNCQEMQNHHSISNGNIQSSFKEVDEGFYPMGHEDIDSAPARSDSKCLHAPQGSGARTDARQDSGATEDMEELKQRVKNMQSELEKYRMFLLQLQGSEQLLFSGVSSGVVRDAGLPVEGFGTQVQGTAMEGVQTSSGVPQLDYEIHTKTWDSESLQAPDAWAAQNLKELLLASEAEVDKEQVVNVHLDEMYHLQSSLRATSPSKYDSLVHSQVRELSFQCQQIKEIRCGCATYHEHLTSLVKAFEQLLQASDVDYDVAEGFREQLNQSVLLFEKLEMKFLYGESIGTEVTILYELAQRNNEKNATMYQHLQDESPVPSALHSSSDFDLSEKSPLGSPEHRHDLEGQHSTLPLLPSKFPPELLMEHLQEIRILRQRLEYSIKTNERLRKQLERQVTDKELDQGSANIFIHGSEQHNSLTSEIHFLRKQNQVLNAMLAKGSRDKQKENEKLRESLSKKNAIIEHLHEDHECMKKENEKLQKQICQKEDEIRYLTCQIYSSRNELNRLQTDINVKQHQISENEKLLQSLRTEIKVYEKLEEARRKGTDSRCDASEEFQKDQKNPLDLHELLAEIQSLRVQLERSMDTNKSLHEKLEEQLSKGKREEGGPVSAVNINCVLKAGSEPCAGLDENLCNCPAARRNSGELQKQQNRNCISAENPGAQAAPKGEGDSASLCSSTSSRTCTPRLVPGHRMWADRNGRHVLGLIEDYDALRKHISEGQQVLADMEMALRGVTGTQLQEPGVKVPEQASLHGFSTSTHTVQQILEEAARSLKLLWRVSLPLKAAHGTAQGIQDEGMKAEIFRLRKKLSEQEKKLHSTVKRLHSTNQLKENMEKVIIDQLVLTHDVLKKARGNLEVPPAENQKSPSYTSKKRIL
ncbi:CDK5 regulatory subunit-associated protein 2 isoform X2 [Passer montanus]|uniref:CDK5 regulatory subunit-associated protein 2 isoform X2 n=1 Tax=Passer montanus TaxID=9160 RepID=UPI00195F9A94|nr:CDK5 regulatory subunit-associated protein 2 isoform X2 [Passer montanus]